MFIGKYRNIWENDDDDDDDDDDDGDDKPW